MDELDHRGIVARFAGAVQRAGGAAFQRPKRFAGTGVVSQAEETAMASEAPVILAHVVFVNPGPPDPENRHRSGRLAPSQPAGIVIAGASIGLAAIGAAIGAETVSEEPVRKTAIVFLLCAAAAQPGLAAGARGRGVAAFNGGWMVSSEGFCTGIGSGQVTILNGRIIGPNGGGRVSASGAVHTITNVNGVTTVSEGQITEGTASGSYRQSTGCSGVWTAVKL